MRYRYILFALLLASTVYGTRYVLAASDDISDLQKQINDRKAVIANLQKQIDTIKKALQNKQLEKVSLQNQLQIINSRLQKTQLDLEATQNHLQETELTLKELDLEIKQKERMIDEDQAHIGELVRELDYGERQTLVSIFARGQTLSDFFSAQDSFQSVDTEVTRTMISVMLAKQELDKKHAQYSSAKAQLENIKVDLASKQDQLTNQSTSKTQLLSETQDSEAKFEKMVADLKKQYSSTEGEIESIERKVRDKLKGSGSTKLVVGDLHMQWPVPSRVVTTRFHDPDYPFRHIFEHSGLDIRAAQGTPVRAAAQGVIARAKNAGMGYSYVIIVHNNKISTLYGHLSRILVTEDEAVLPGDIIGYSGGTPGTPGAGPFVTGAHLHFEVRSEGIPVNPLDYLP